MREDWDDIPEGDVDEVFRDVLQLVMDKMEEGCNPMALDGVMMAQAMMMYKTHLTEDSYDKVMSLILESRDRVGKSGNKLSKWNDIINQDQVLRCKSEKDVKTVKIFEICKWEHCDHQNSDVYDDGLFIGRVQINMNNGTKRRFLYFQADYQLRN